MPLKNLGKFVLDLFFPKKCLGCNRPDTYLCRACFNKIELSLNNTCFFCGKITWQGKICLNCQKQNYLDRLIAATEYKNPVVREAIKKFKYNYVKELVEPLSKLLIKSLEQNFQFPISNFQFLVVPVPLYKIRERGRGFNQAEILAKEIADYFNLPMETGVIKRIIPTEPQADIKNNDEKRKANIRGVFNISPKPNVIQGKNIILIDDVATTGATLIEIAKILKNSGANEVWGLVVSRGK
jgi:ComF family protein